MPGHRDAGERPRRRFGVHPRDDAYEPALGNQLVECPADLCCTAEARQILPKHNLSAWLGARCVAVVL
ncbi:hypothetical protein BM449_00585 [Synechococcus sp. SynAce01]|nr:hypothetical protein BM449_00585 [Synechococcus sp. SynAce01]